ncbi:uncharacterized protein FYW49_007841 [Xenentodon cancila]
MNSLNRTLLLALFSRYQKTLVDADINVSERQMTRTNSNTTVSPLTNTSPVFTTSSSRDAYDNAYFYILFVMIFYSFLAMALFKCSIASDEEEKDPYEEFMGNEQPSTQTFSAGHMVEKFYFEEENSLNLMESRLVGRREETGASDDLREGWKHGKSVGQWQAGISSCEAQSGSITPGPSACTLRREAGIPQHTDYVESTDTVCLFEDILTISFPNL